MSAPTIGAERIGDARRIPNEKIATLLAALVALAVFGPYVAGPIRTEQIAVYGLGAMVLPLTWVRLRPGAGLGVMMAWTVMFAMSLVGVVFPYQGPQPYDPGNVLAGIDNLVLPLVIMALVWSAVRADIAASVLDRFARVVVWGAAMNGAVALISTRIPLAAYLRPFWSGTEGKTTAENAAELGRLSGIFNQPAEAGVLYGVAGLLAIYLYPSRSRPLFLALAAITAGGILSVSKVFIFGGLPIILLVLLRQAGRRRIVHLVIASVVGVALIESGLFGQWTGSVYLLDRLFPSGDVSLIEFYSAGRWNTGSGMQGAISSVLGISPWTGVGAGGWDVPYDSAWTEALIVAGLIGAACVALTLFQCGRIAMRESDPRRRVLLICLAVFLVGASLGIPALTANRVATIVWVTLALLIRAHRPTQ